MQISISFVDLALGGAQILLIQLAEGLARRGHVITYFLFAHPNDTLHRSPVLFDRLNSTAQQVLHPSDMLNSQILQLDGYHNLWHKIPYLRIWKRCVETYHSSYSLKRSSPLYAPHRICASHAIQKELHKSSLVIHNGIPIPEFVKKTTKDFDITILGRIHPVKGHLLFLDICQRLFQRRGSLHALIIGGHPHPSAYQEKVDTEILKLRKLGVQIHITGDIDPDQVNYWLQRSKMLLVTSQYEGFGRMAVEAMSCQLPVIANPVGGMLEVIEGGKTGYFARLNDTVSFADLANRLLEDNDLSHYIGCQGRKRVEECFSLEKMVIAYEAFYLDILNSV